jgi:hypothetical protein
MIDKMDEMREINQKADILSECARRTVAAAAELEGAPASTLDDPTTWVRALVDPGMRMHQAPADTQAAEYSDRPIAEFKYHNLRYSEDEKREDN